MSKSRRQFSPADPLDQARLESRVVLSAVAAGLPTATTMTVGGGTLGQPTTFNVTVRASAGEGAPQGTVNLIDHGQVIQTLTLSPTPSTHPGRATSTASYTLVPAPGTDAPFYGKHAITAQFVPAGGFATSDVTRAYNVARPHFTTIAHGVKVATVAAGSGPAIQSGQYAEVLYTGYLAKNGTIFDASSRENGVPLGFNLGGNQVIPGFDAGTTGMQIGETRIIEIPPAQGYGSTANGPIPANSTLIFLVTLKAIV